MTANLPTLPEVAELLRHEAYLVVPGEKGKFERAAHAAAEAARRLRTA
jgi:hypothetical protein